MSVFLVVQYKHTDGPDEPRSLGLRIYYLLSGIVWRRLQAYCLDKASQHQLQHGTEVLTLHWQRMGRAGAALQVSSIQVSVALLQACNSDEENSVHKETSKQQANNWGMIFRGRGHCDAPKARRRQLPHSG